MTFSDVSLHLPADLGTVSRARHFVRDVLLQWGFATLCDDGQLGASELVANAVSHAHTPVRLTIRRDLDHGVLIEVHDSLPEFDFRDVSSPVPCTATGGRGLRIVDAISEQWGVEQREHGKSVWFRLVEPAADGRVDEPVGAGTRAHAGTRS